MKPTIVIFELHSEYVVPKFFEQCIDQLVQDNYLAFCDETNACFNSLTAKVVEEEIGLSIKQFKQELATSTLLDANQREQLEQTIRENEQRRMIYKALSRYPSTKLYGIDDFLGKNRDLLKIRPDLLGKVRAIRDQGMAQALEQVRKVNEEQGIGVIAILGIGHYSIQHFLINIMGQEAAKYYRFFYLYKDKLLRPDNLLEIEKGYRFEDVYPLGFTAINCNTQSFKEVYLQIKATLNSESQLKVNPQKMTQLLSVFQKEIDEGKEAVQTLLRISITTSHIGFYFEDYPQFQMDRNKLFHLLVEILTQFNKKGLVYNEQLKVFLNENIKLLIDFQIPIESIEIYQEAIDFLIPRIQQEFASKNLSDHFAKDFLQPTNTVKYDKPQLLKEYGFFACSLAVVGAIVKSCVRSEISH